MMNTPDITPRSHPDQPIRVPVKTCSCHKDLTSACRWARPVLEDAGNYIRFMSRQLRDSGAPEICREARIVLLDNIQKALEKIDSVMSNLDEDLM
ncbi:MAG: hypothetical protein R3F48_13255 [Candidatus Zixiibacteriota bacterium]